MEYLIPGTLTTIYQSNRITTGAFQGFGLLHTKIFIAIIKSLQEAIKAELNGLDWQQMKLFDQVTKDTIQVKLHLKDIASANHYGDVLKAAKELMQLVLQLKKNNSKQDFVSFRTLFTGVDAPVKIEGKTVLKIHVLKDVAKEIIAIDRNKDGKTTNFTKFIYETAMASNSKYTARIYILISSWKIKGGFYITMEDLRRVLDIEEKEYVNFSDFNKRILLPAQVELEGKADCWFNAAAPDFQNKIGKKVIGLNFKVITQTTRTKQKEKVEYIRHILRSHASFQDRDFVPIKEVLDQTEELDDILVKIIYLIGKNQDEEGKKIKNKIAYITHGLVNEFLTSF